LVSKAPQTCLALQVSRFDKNNSSASFTYPGVRSFSSHQSGNSYSIAEYRCEHLVQILEFCLSLRTSAATAKEARFVPA